MTCKPDNLNLPQLDTQQSSDVFVPLCKTIDMNISDTYQISTTKARLLRTEVYYFGHLRQHTVQSNLLQYSKIGEARKEVHKENSCKLAALEKQPENRQDNSKIFN